MLVYTGQSAFIEGSKDIYTIAVKEWSAKIAKRLYVSLFDALVNKLQQWLCLDKSQYTNALVPFYLPLIIYYYFTPSPHSFDFSI